MNADCWRLVFDRLCIQDVVRCERVCRGWQRAVKEYLTGVHHFWVEGLFFYESVPDSYFENKRGLYCINKTEIFLGMIQKLGRFMKSLVVKVNAEEFRGIIRHCPNLEDLTLIEPTCNMRLDLLKNLKHIRQILLHDSLANDSQLSKVVGIKSLEELTIFGNSGWIGGFFNNLNPNLRILNLHDCVALFPERFQSCTWPAIKQLQLRHVKGHDNEVNQCGTLPQLPLLLDKMPNLERFAFTSFWSEDAIFFDQLLKSVCRLNHLKELHLRKSYFVTDDWLRGVAKGLKGLEAVDVSQCYKLTAVGVLELCRAHPTLKRLGLGGLNLTEADVEACVYYCEGLELLDVWYNSSITMGMLERIARPRVHALHLRLYDTRSRESCGPVYFEGLRIIWHWMERKWIKPYCKITLNLDTPIEMMVYATERE